ncbi:MAG: ABC transporter ATP-binding protein [Candidatus Hermodarchaeota archaeon]
MNENNSIISLDHVYRDYRVSKKTKFLRKELTIINALVDVCFNIKEGEIFGLVGPNGAGKTTLIKILATLLYPTKGNISIAGFDVIKQAREVRKIVNMAAGAERMLHYRLTGRENLLYYAELYNVPRPEVTSRVEELLALVGMTEKADIPVERYSKGMRQRIQVARALINNPRILLLDEPTLGLDVEVARDIRALVMKRVKEQALTVLLTSHYLFEIDEMVDRLAIIDQGKIIALDTPTNLKNKMNLTQSVNFVIDPVEESKIMQIKDISGVLSIDVHNTLDPITGTAGSQKLSITANQEFSIPKLISTLNDMTTIRYLDIGQSTLEDAFLKVIEKSKGVA